MRPRVVVSGPFPPPVHGLAVVNQALADHLSGLSDVLRLDIAGPPASGPQRPAGAVARSLHAAAELRRLRSALHPRGQAAAPAPAVVVIGLSAGAAQWADVAVARQALAAGVRVVVHHHSPWPFERADRLHPFRLAAGVWRRCEHLVLCSAMGQALQATMEVPPRSIDVLSNAAWVTAAPARLAPVPDGPAWRLGFLGQVNEAKGALRFLDVVDRLVAAGRPVSAEIAGPLDPAIADRFRRRLASQPAARWLGPLDAEARSELLQRTDWLLLPTTYRHEAQPLVILEALAHGVPALATPRGCIGSSLVDGDSVRAFAAGSFVDEATALLGSRCADRDSRAGSASRAVAHWQRLHEQGLRQRDAVVGSWLVGPSTITGSAGRGAGHRRGA